MIQEKNAMMRDEISSIMDLEFFSKRFNIRKDVLSWGLQQITTEDCTSYAPVIIIEGTQDFIDLRKDIRVQRKSIYGNEAVLFPALMTETDKAYKFSSQDAEYIFTKDDVRALYEKKVLF